MATALSIEDNTANMIKPSTRAHICLLVIFLTICTACHTRNKAQKGAAIGAGAGGIVGAFIGKSAGNTALGALIGGAVGGTAGAFVGRNMDRQAAELKESIPGASVIRVGEGIIVRFDSGILFDVDKADVKAGANDNLKNLAESLQKNVQTDLIIIGHTDNTGTPVQNLDLSLRRAQSVKDYLVTGGVDAARISTQGKGETEPIADNATEDGRAQNRRVEIIIIANKQMRNQATQAGK